MVSVNQRSHHWGTTLWGLENIVSFLWPFSIRNSYGFSSPTKPPQFGAPPPGFRSNPVDGETAAIFAEVVETRPCSRHQVADILSIFH